MHIMFSNSHNTMYEGAIVFDENVGAVVDPCGHASRYFDACVHLPTTADGRSEPAGAAILYHNPNAWYAVRGAVEDKGNIWYPPYDGLLSDHGRQILSGILKRPHREIQATWHGS